MAWRLNMKTDRKERIESTIKELDQQYQYDEKFRKNIQPLIDKLYDPIIPEKDLDILLDRVRDTYKTHYETKSNLKGAEEGIASIAENVKKIAEHYQRQGEHMKKINDGLKRIVELAEPAKKQMEENLKLLQNTKETLDANNDTLRKSAHNLERTNKTLEEQIPSSPVDLKKLN